MKRTGFTIVELLIVIAVIGVLSAIVTTVALGSMRNARGKRADMMAMALEQGITAYYAHTGEWPDAIKDVIDGEGDTYTFSPSEADKILNQVVGKCFGRKGEKKVVLLDAMALFVANKKNLRNGGKGCHDNHDNSKLKSFCGNMGCIGGVDFTTAIAKSGKHHIPFDDMAYGYQGTKYGKFCRFTITYNRKTDSVSVTK